MRLRQDDILNCTERRILDVEVLEPHIVRKLLFLLVNLFTFGLPCIILRHFPRTFRKLVSRQTSLQNLRLDEKSVNGNLLFLVCSSSSNSSANRWVSPQASNKVTDLPQVISLVKSSIDPQFHEILTYASSAIVVVVEHRRYLLVKLTDSAAYNAALFSLPSSLSSILATELRKICPAYQPQRSILRLIFGPNHIAVAQSSFFMHVLNVLLHPFFIFQMFAIMLWMLENYRMYAATIFLISVFGAVFEASEVYHNSLRLKRLAGTHPSSTLFSLVSQDESYAIPVEDLLPADQIQINSGDTLPADCHLVSGSCLVDESSLTGESIPVRKLSLTSDFKLLFDECSDRFGSSPIHPNSVSQESTLFAGTRVVSALRECRALIFAVGSETARGQLIREILNETDTPVGWTAGKSNMKRKSWLERSEVGAGNQYDAEGQELERGLLMREPTPESPSGGTGWRRAIIQHPEFEIYCTLCILLFVGVIGALWSAWIFVAKFRLSLWHAIITSLDLVTITVPPALPITVTFGLAYAVKRLRAGNIYCVRSSAISKAAYVDEVFFDKTGTLTESTLRVAQVLPCEPELSNISLITGRNTGTGLPFVLELGLAVCHALAKVNDHIEGDEIDKQCFLFSKWNFSDSETDLSGFEFTVCPRNLPGICFGVRKIYAFDPALMRMSTVVVDLRTEQKFLFAKGAPESIFPLCNGTAGDSARRTVLAETKKGRRVVAIAYKMFPNTTSLVELLESDRSSLEDDLKFLGLVALENVLKEHTRQVVMELKGEAGIETRMVTGDHLATAVYVARQCGILQSGVVNQQHSSRTVIIDLWTKEGPSVAVAFRNADTSEAISEEGLENLALSSSSPTTHSVNVCQQSPRLTLEIAITGRALSHIISNAKYGRVLLYTLNYGKVFARMSPSQKADLVNIFQNFKGSRVLMCGDGANDAGAIKTAEMGIAMCPKSRRMTSAAKNILGIQRVFKFVLHLFQDNELEEFIESGGLLSAPCVAATSSIETVVKVIRHGQAAAEASLSSFQYMFLYSIIQFSSVAMLYQQGTVFSDGQFLVADLVIVMPLALLTSRLGPALKLASNTPPSSVWDRRISIRTLYLAATNLTFQIIVSCFLIPQHPVIKQDIFLKGELVVESVAATGLFFLTNWQYIATCVAINLTSPFRRHLIHNRAATLYIVVLAVICTSLSLFPLDEKAWLSRWLQIVPLPWVSRFLLLGALATNFFFLVRLSNTSC